MNDFLFFSKKCEKAVLGAMPFTKPHLRDDPAFWEANGFGVTKARLEANPAHFKHLFA